MPRRSGDVLRVCALYPDLMNIYADRGNILLLQRRCSWRGIELRVTAAGLGEAIDPDAHELFYLGGGQDRDQALCAQDLVETKRDALHAAADRGAVIFGVCGGYQLLGRDYELGERAPPRRRAWWTSGPCAMHGPRLIGNVAIEVDLGDGPRVLAGFENHGGRTHLGAGRAAARPGPARSRQRRAVRRARACAAPTSSAPICTAPCCPRTRGSPTG